jgi:hypothetical protein
MRVVYVARLAPAAVAARLPSDAIASQLQLAAVTGIVNQPNVAPLRKLRW